jgi:hypothetical protein
MRGKMQAARLTATEHQEQVGLFDWINKVGHRTHPDLLDAFAIPNGGHRFHAVAAKLKAEGVKAGVWDVLLPVPIDPFPGLWVEMKAGKNKCTENQLDWARRMKRHGYAMAVCYSWEGAVQAMVDYLEGRPVSSHYPPRC